MPKLTKHNTSLASLPRGKGGKKKEKKNATPHSEAVSLIRSLDKLGLVNTSSPELTLMRRSMISSSLGGGGRLRVWLPLSPVNVASSVGSIINTQAYMRLNTTVDYAQWQLAFTTFRLVEAELQYVPYFAGSSTNTGQCVGGLRYGDVTTTVTSTDAVLQYDDWKMFPLFEREKWSMKWGSGYEDYLPMVVSVGQTFGTLNLYNNTLSGVGVSTSYGCLCGRLLFEFEGLI